MQSEKENTNSPMTSLPMPNPLSSVLNSMSISQPSLPKSETGQNQNALATPTGKPPSAMLLDDLREQAEMAQRGNLVSDESLRALLLLAFGSRLDIRKKTKPFYGSDHGYDERIIYEISIDRIDDAEIPIFTAMEFFNKPAKAEQIAGLITRMRVSLIRRAEENTDAEMLIDTLTEMCRDYPFDILKFITMRWLSTKKFFPVPSEFLAELNECVAFRKTVMRSFEEARNPLLAEQRKTARIAADQRTKELGEFSRETR